MKKDTHPDYHIIDVKMTNGDVVQMRWGSSHVERTRVRSVAPGSLGFPPCEDDSDRTRAG